MSRVFDPLLTFEFHFLRFPFLNFVRVANRLALARNWPFRTESYFLPAMMKVASENNAHFVIVRCFIKVTPPE